MSCFVLWSLKSPLPLQEPNESHAPSECILPVEADKTVERSGRRPVLRLISTKIDVMLTESQLWRLRSGCTSIPYQKHLASVGMAHSVSKYLTGDGAGDFFQRHIYYVSPDGKTDENGMHKVDVLIGPMEPLIPEQARVVIFKQKLVKGNPPLPNFGCEVPEYWWKDPENPRDENAYYYIHCIYDNHGAVFIDGDGNCLFVKRDQLCLNI